eukprot:COSAG01_NODE_27129_length_693_cov_1.611111_1_plen_137_part_10
MTAAFEQPHKRDWESNQGACTALAAVTVGVDRELELDSPLLQSMARILPKDTPHTIRHKQPIQPRSAKTMFVSGMRASRTVDPTGTVATAIDAHLLNFAALYLAINPGPKGLIMLAKKKKGQQVRPRALVWLASVLV